MLGRAMVGGMLVSLLACGGSTVVGGTGDGGGTTSDVGGMSSASGGSTSSGGTTSVGGSGGEGASVPAWEHNCAMTGIAIDKGFGPVQLFDAACPNDGWSLMHYDGATAYGESPGFTGNLDFRACDATGDQRIILSAYIDGTGTLMLDFAEYREGPDEDYQLTPGGILDITADGDIGEVVEGSYQGSFAPVQNDGPPIQLSGSVRACHLPELAAP